MKELYGAFKLPNSELINMNKLINKVIKANIDIAVYNEKLKSSKIRPELLLSLLSLREAIESTKIEGTQVTMDEMLEYRAEEKGESNDIREVVNYYIFDKGLISKANFFVSESLEKDKFKYYQLLNNTRVVVADKEDDEEQHNKDIRKARENFTEWIEFFLTACINQAAKNIDKIDRINNLYEETIQKSKSLVRSSGIQDVINIIFEYPVFTTNTIKERLDIAPATLNGYLKKLIDAKIIYSDGKARNRKHFFYDLINIISYDSAKMLE